MAKLSPTLVAAATLALTSACYTGVANFDTPAKDTAGIADSDPSADSGGGDAGGGGDDGAGDSAGDDHGEPFAPDPGQIRLLSAEEFTNTVQDLLGVKVEAELSYSDRASGYDNSNNAQIDENLLSILYVEAERVAEVYIAERLAADFTCYAPGPALTPACAEAIIDGLGRRAYRRHFNGQIDVVLNPRCRQDRYRHAFRHPVDVPHRGAHRVPLFGRRQRTSRTDDHNIGIAAAAVNLEAVHARIQHRRPCRIGVEQIPSGRA